MKAKAFHIVIADRNAHVLDFLRREFQKSGYDVTTAGDAFNLCKILRSEDKPDLVVLDPDLPFMDDVAIGKLLEWQDSGMPLVLHSFLYETTSHPLSIRASALLKKSGNPELLTSVVKTTLEERATTH